MLRSSESKKSAYRMGVRGDVRRSKGDSEKVLARLLQYVG